MLSLSGKRWVLLSGVGIVALGVTVSLIEVYFTPPDTPHPSFMENRGSDNRRHQTKSWTADPLEAGSLLPPTGRSLFDYLVTETTNGQKIYDVPFPFTALVKKIEEQVGGDRQDNSSLKRVLIPLGRSLQRSAGAPEFFKYPRAVVAIDSESTALPGQAGLLLKDRLYLGYHEKADLIEVISYNEAAGRFEFQVVRDYREAGTPQVLYANRSLCVSCHRNQAPIFSRQVWDETNGNPDIAARLKAARGNFYGFPVEQGVDVPNAIDNAVERANRFAATQLLWNTGCENGREPREAIECRADILIFMLQYRLSGERFFDRGSPRYQKHFIGSFTKGWQKTWPRGLQLPDPSISNRKLSLEHDRYTGEFASQPAKLTASDLIQKSDVSYPFDPLNPRAALETWNVTDTDNRDADRVISGVAEFVTSKDIRRLDDHLFANGRQATGRRNEYHSSCGFISESHASIGRASTLRVKFRCDGGGPPGGKASQFSLQGRVYAERDKIVGGSIDRLVVNGSPPLHDLDILPATINRRGAGAAVMLPIAQKLNGLHARLPDGNAIEFVTLSWDSARAAAATFAGKVKVTTLEDFTPVHKAIGEMARRTRAGEIDALSAQPFRRSAVMKELFTQVGLPPLSWCCGDDEAMPAPVADAPPKEAKKQNDGGGSTVEKFYNYCAVCHAMKDGSPANFLYGDEGHVRAQLAHCAERIFFRLEMARVGPQQRLKSPMPPLRMVGPAKSDGTRERDLATLRDYVANMIREQSGNPPSLDAMIAAGYWKLRSCLPGEKGQRIARAN